ncbi:MAG: hypothetical protein QXQ02_03190 [Halobacteria archaeon]
MMKVLTEYQFRTRTRTTYDWNTILDGKIRLLESGKDFLCKPETFVIRARTIAKKHGMKLRASVSEKGDVVLQAVQPLDPKHAQKVGQEKSSSSQVDSATATKEDEEREEECLDEEWEEEDAVSENEQLDEESEEWEEDDEVEAALKAFEKRERKKYK